VIENMNIIDLNLLRPWFSVPEIEKAIKAYIRSGKQFAPGGGLAGDDRKGGIPGVNIYDARKGTFT